MREEECSVCVPVLLCTTELLLVDCHVTLCTLRSFTFNLLTNTLRWQAQKVYMMWLNNLAPFILALSSLLMATCEGGKIMFWMPVGSKSMKITYMPMLEELAKRGHEITVVHPHKSKQSAKGIIEILSSDKVDKFLNDLST